MNDSKALLEKAKSLLAEVDCLLISAGAGMGVDSGLPDFRGKEGFWRAYPPYEKMGLEFMSVANPDNFFDDPEFAWGFYGHRFNLYRETKPHRGFELLKDFAKQLPAESFVFTSNVDGHFETAGFSADQVLECHGSINYYQCVNDCSGKLYSTEDWQLFQIDQSEMTASEPLPKCPVCNGTARPAILMFGDWGWNSTRTDEQGQRFEQWLRGLGNKRVGVIEMGAGTAIPSVRYQSEQVAGGIKNAFLIRINPRESQMPGHLEGVSLAMGALSALEQIIPT